MASNCSSAKPSGSITEWQLAQLGFVRCCANRSRIVGGGASGLVSARFVSTPGGGGGARQTEDVVQQKLAAQDRRRAIGIGRGRQHRSVSEQPASLIAISERDAPEPAAIHARDPVVASQPFVDERVVRVEELCDAAILAKRAPKQQFGFTLERLQQALVVGRISIGIDDDLETVGAGSATERRIHRRGLSWPADRPASAAPLDRGLTASQAACARPGRASAHRGCCSTGRTTVARRPRGRSDDARGARRARGRRTISIHAQQEGWVDEHSLERELNPGIEASAVPSPALEKGDGVSAAPPWSPAFDRRAWRSA